MEGARSWKVFCFQKITNIKICNLKEMFSKGKQSKDCIPGRQGEHLGPYHEDGGSNVEGWHESAEAGKEIGSLRSISKTVLIITLTIHKTSLTLPVTINTASYKKAYMITAPC
jgi:hypothetical protein